VTTAFTPFFGPTLETSKKTLFDLIGYKIYADPVRRFHLSAARHLVVSAPARTSKSYAAAPEAIHAFFPRYRIEEVDGEKKIVAERDETVIWMVAVDYSMAKEWDYAWAQLIDKRLIEKFGGKIEQSYNSPNQGNLLIRVAWPFLTSPSAGTVRSVLQVKSASNEKTLQGEQVTLAIVSEAAEHTPDLLPKYLETRCHRIIYPTTPKRKAKWLYDLARKGEQNPALSVEHITFTKECNPAYDWEGYRIAREKSRLTFGAPENDPGFLEQFEGVWTFEGGKVLPFRWLEDGHGECNIVQKLPSWVYNATWVACCDYGYNDPTFVGFIALDPGSNEMVLASEIYQRGLVVSDVVAWAKKREADLGIRVNQWVPDPQEPQLTEVMRRAGLPLFHAFTPNYLRDRAAGYGELRDLLAVDPATKRPRLFVHASCENAIREMTDIRFKDGVRDEFSEGALIGADHAIDALRAFARSRPRAQTGDSDWYKDWLVKRREGEAYRRQFERPQHFIGATSRFERIHGAA
jgi:hypothetical protein